MEKQELSKAQCFLVTIFILEHWQKIHFCQRQSLSMQFDILWEETSVAQKRTCRLLSKTGQNNQKLKLREGNQDGGFLEKLDVKNQKNDSNSGMYKMTPSLEKNKQRDAKQIRTRAVQCNNNNVKNSKCCCRSRAGSGKATHSTAIVS